MLHDPVGVGRLAARGVLCRRNPEEDETRNAERDQSLRLDDEGVDGVLGLPGHRRDRDRTIDALAYEEGCDQIVDTEARFGHQATESGSAPKTSQPPNGELGRVDRIHCGPA